MESRCFESVVGFSVKNKVNVNVLDHFKELLSPVRTSRHMTRIYQEISFCFVLVSLIPENINVTGSVRLVDLAGDSNDSLGTITWGSTPRLWGYIMSSSSFLSCEILERLGILFHEEAEAYPPEAYIASCRMLIRIGVDSPIMRIKDVFCWPSSSEFDSQVFSSVVEQDKMMRLISSYYSRGLIDGQNMWTSLNHHKLGRLQPNTQELAIKIFPFLQGSLHCTSVYYLDFRCRDRSEEFLTLVIDSLRNYYSNTHSWRECGVEALMRELISRCPSPIHVSHKLDYGYEDASPMMRICSGERFCIGCKRGLEGLERLSLQQIQDASVARESGGYYKLGSLISSLGRLWFSSGGISQILSRIFLS